MSMNLITVVTTLAAAIEAMEGGAFVVATHGGPVVHADESAAAALFYLTHPGRRVVVFRIERGDEEGLAWAKSRCPYVFDVGGKAGDEPAVVLDHHFLGLDAPEAAKAKAVELGLDPDKMSGKDYQQVADSLLYDGVPYSSVGLVHKWYRTNRHVPTIDTPDIRQIVASIDASDNGISGVVHGVQGVPEGIAMLVHKASPVPLAGGELTPEAVARHFEAVAGAFVSLFQGTHAGGGDIFRETMEYLAAQAEAGRQASRDRVTPLIGAAGEVLVLDQYESAALDVLGEKAETSKVLYLVFPTGSQWMVQQAPLRPMPCFEGKKPLPEAWAGLRNDPTQGRTLAEETGVEDAIFCHPGRFIGGAQYREGAIKLAELAVRE